MAEETGRNYSTIHSWLRLMNVEIRPRVKNYGNKSRLDELEVKQCVFLYERVGMTQAEIAKMLKIGPNGVRRRLVYAGVELRNMRETGKLSWDRRKGYKPLGVIGHGKG